MVKEKKYLITTNIDINNKIDHKKVILGDWCIGFEDIEILNDKSYLLLNYHWDNRDKLKKDYKLINKIYEKFLNLLTVELNSYHQKNFSKRYWRIIIGPWLGSILCIIFDRWTSVKNAKINHKNLYLIFSKNNLEEMIPINTIDFYSKIYTDLWNKYLFQIIAQELDLNIEYKDEDSNTKLLNKKLNKKVLKLFKYLIPNLQEIKKFLKKFITRKLISILSINRSKKNRIIVYSIYLNLISKLALIIKDNRILFPYFDESIKDKKFDFKFRRKNISYKKEIFYNFEKDFISFCAKIIPLLIPKIFLENYQEGIKISSNNSLKKVNYIMTSNGIYAEEIFKFYTADLVEKGGKLFIYQHGGCYGNGQFSFFDDHEYLISDYFLSWGWNFYNKKKIIPFGALNLFSIKGKQKKRNKKGILLILMGLPKYSYYLYSIPISSSQIKSYHYDQFRLIDFLPKKISNDIEVKLHPQDFGYNLEKEWNKRFPNIKIIKNKKVTKISSDYKICICSYNATTFLELLHLNNPTICFWNKNNWELNHKSEGFFNLLKESKILHDTPESASRFLIENYENIEIWWYSKDTQKARKLFCQKFAYIPNNPLLEISRLIK